MQSNQSAPMLDEILQALGEKAGTAKADQVAEELQRYLDYGVPPQQAKSTILRHHGVQGATRDATGASPRVTLQDLKPNDPNVTLLVRVVTINEKEITVKGEKRRIQYGIFGDETMTRPFTAWKPITAAKGDVLRIKGAYTREYQGEPEVQLGDRVNIEPGDESLVPKTPTLRPLKVADLGPGMSNIEISARILNVAPRKVAVQGVEKTVWSGVLADGTGKCGFTSWHDFKLKDGQAVKVKGGYVREFRSQPQFTFDEKATLEVLADTAVPSLAEIANAAPVPLADLYLGGGALDVTVEATLVEVRPGSGLVLRCNECKRTLSAGACRLHGKQVGVNDLRIKAVLDDGTGAVNAIIGRETTEALLGRTLDEALKAAKDAGTPEVIERDLKAKLLGRPLRARGNVLVDEFGPSLLVQEASLVQRDLAAAAEALLAELEGAA